MDRFTFYTKKIDDIHVIDEITRRTTGTSLTLCRGDVNSANYFENDRFKNIDASRKQLRSFCPGCIAQMMILSNTAFETLTEELYQAKLIEEYLRKVNTDLMSEEQLRKDHPLVQVMSDERSREVSGPIVEKPTEIPGRPVAPPFPGELIRNNLEIKDDDELMIQRNGQRDGGKFLEMYNEILGNLKKILLTDHEPFFTMAVIGKKPTGLQELLEADGFNVTILQDSKTCIWNVVVREKRVPIPIAIEGEYQELTEDSPFTDGQTLEDVPKCAIPGCKNKGVRYWIHPKGKEQKFFCGDCPGSQIEILDKFAASIGEEVAAYDEPVWAVEMLYRAPEDDTRTWLIKAPNMAAAIERAKEGDYDYEPFNGSGFAQGEFIPINIRGADEEEKEEFDKYTG